MKGNLGIISRLLKNKYCKVKDIYQKEMRSITYNSNIILNTKRIINGYKD